MKETVKTIERQATVWMKKFANHIYTITEGPVSEF